jgi:hypothetical protein
MNLKNLFLLIVLIIACSKADSNDAIMTKNDVVRFEGSTVDQQSAFIIGQAVLYRHSKYQIGVDEINSVPDTFQSSHSTS